MKSKKIRCRKISKIGIDLSHILLCHSVQQSESCFIRYIFFSRKCVHETEFIWNKLAKKDDHKRDEKMCTNETVLPNSEKNSCQNQMEQIERFVLSFNVYFFFLFINYWPAQTHKTRQIRENQQCQTKSNIHIYRRRKRDGERGIERARVRSTKKKNGCVYWKWKQAIKSIYLALIFELLQLFAQFFGSYSSIVQFQIISLKISLTVQCTM